MANDVTWNFTVNRKTTFATFNSRILNRVTNHFCIIHDFAHFVSFFRWNFISIFINFRFIWNQNGNDFFEQAKLVCCKSNSTTESHFFSHDRILRIM